ncbi:ATP-grasp domain-containing protein [Rathayibacter toxicus]|uniref:ATP-grasp domain-containing protein n=1 Tax=Rathayibacter toxicus TaxID=145458 RepID=A0A0C5BR49_9MICO|nr:ATP-grasp domain-containing protein [Rathayibacter toxicus]AJM77107.1 hypothetical protein TI83_02295 [Rathayibacter toxicus]ALS57061.1 hypothetical protein APU90_04180 [Rathayibacter toxicus]KKM46114.1 hypothetical protein VT73_03305 [Rathayibacter toxicus]PPG23066.1 ATP-grasp domain-containing protein [Rathayibacter toxicus]PPG47648.1 ATP-grasp domain-containing protein [Rathayibacter toxicus]
MTGDTIETVVVGYSSTLLSALEGRVPDRSVVIIDEPDMIVTRDIATQVEGHPSCAGLIPLGIHDEVGTPPVIAPPPGVTAVVSPTEYGVVWAAELAREWGLPGAGIRAARILRDKIALRTVMHGIVRQPDWSHVTSLAAAEVFAQQHPAGFVLKPSNLQGSVGVQVLDSMSLLENAWSECLTAAEPRYRASTATPPRIMMESRLNGAEVSVEVFVRNGVIVFLTVTEKSVLDGIHPVEIGHIVPAPDLSRVARERLWEAMRRLITATGFRTGALHAEWFIDDDVPSLVECAGRVPGDGIHQLVSLAYGWDYLSAWLDLMRGREIQLCDRATATAAVVLARIPLDDVAVARATAAARAVPGVAEASLTPAAPGHVVSSQDRNVAVSASGVSAREARAAVDTALARIRECSCLPGG